MTSSMGLRGPNWLVIVLTLFVACLLTLCPLRGYLIWLRPAWVMMVLVYWSVMFPGQVGIGMAWVAGLLLDVLQGTLLGEHALAMTVAVFLVLRIRTRFRFFPMMQQALSLCGMVFVYQLILFCIQGFLGQPPVGIWYWLPSLTSMLLWPWVFSTLQRCHTRFAKA